MWCQPQEVHWHEEAAAAGFLLGVGTGLFVSRLFASPQAPKAKNKPPYRAIMKPRYRRASPLRRVSQRHVAPAPRRSFVGVASDRSYDPESLYFLESALHHSARDIPTPNGSIPVQDGSRRSSSDSVQSFDPADASTWWNLRRLNHWLQTSTPQPLHDAHRNGSTLESAWRNHFPLGSDHSWNSDLENQDELNL